MSWNRVSARMVYGGSKQIRLPPSCWEDSEGVQIGDEVVVSLHCHPRRNTQKVKAVMGDDNKINYFCMTLDAFHDVWVELRKIHP